MKGRKPTCNIYYASSSEQFASQVQHLLLSSEIQSSRRVTRKKSYRPMFHVQVEGSSNQLLFLKKIGCAGQRGKRVSEFITKLENVHQNSNNDSLPKEAWRLFVQPAKNQAKIGWRDVCRGLKTAYCESTLIKSGISRKRTRKLPDFLKSKELQTLAESDIYWDEITSITELGTEDVYDATVPGVHNFVANDIVVHNSLEQDADIVMMLFRRDYYDKYDKPGMANIIIAKNRHGPVGDVQLTFRKEIGQFANYSPMHTAAETQGGNEEAFSAFSSDDS